MTMAVDRAPFVLAWMARASPRDGKPCAAGAVLEKSIKVIRWLLVIPSALLGWYMTFFVFISFLSLIEALCPPDEMISGFCTASWYRPAADGLIIAGASFSAMPTILGSTWMAPAKKALVCHLTYTAGLIVALGFAIETSLWAGFLGASLVGGLTVLAVKKQVGKTCA